NGKPLAANEPHDYKYVGGQETWTALKSGKLPWKLIEKKSEFEALAAGPTPAKVVGTAQVGSTLQEKRGRTGTHAPCEPFIDPKNANVPSLATMARAAINCLDDNPKGFYLMIEGGAVDWANHANEPDRLIEEQIDFVQAIEAVAAWIESHGGWDQTLLILTADHESGLLWGPDSNEVAFQPLKDRGPGRLPGLRYNSHGHANSLVPVYARGPGRQRFAAFARDKDEKAAAQWGVSGQYLDNTNIFQVMRAEVDADQ
ncbi:MAG: alkaline phosphatase, partial [Thermoguttaceae bacterium]